MMKFIFIFLLFLNNELMSQDYREQGCEGVNYEVQNNKNFIKINGVYFNKPAFVIADTCFHENRLVKRIVDGVFEYYPAELLSKERVVEIESFLAEELDSPTDSCRLSLRKKKSIRRKYYRQYLAYIKSDGNVEVNVYFCTSRFLKEHPSFKYLKVSPLFLNQRKGDVYNCTGVLSDTGIQMKAEFQRMDFK